MKFAVALVAGVASTVLGMLGAAEAGQYGERSVYRPRHLPPFSGVLRMNPDSFGRGDGRMARNGWAMRGEPRGRFDHDRPEPLDDRSYADGSYGGRPYDTGYDRSYAPRHVRAEGYFYGPAYGRQAEAFPQLIAGGYGAGEPRHVQRRPQRWNGDGTGVIGILGDGGSLFSSGASYGSGALPEAPLDVAYGEPVTGGLGYYGSGSPGRLPYYSSGSSAGPYGSPGGLAIYSSGAYGSGPHVINVSRRQAWRGVMRPDCTCRPHIIRMGQRQRHRADW